MIIKKHKIFQKSYKKLTSKLQQKVDRVVAVFWSNPLHHDLRNHALHDEYAGCRSIDVTGDWRIVFRQIDEKTYEIVELIDVGTHAQLYG